MPPSPPPAPFNSAFLFVPGDAVRVVSDGETGVVIDAAETEHGFRFLIMVAPTGFRRWIAPDRMEHI